MLRRIYTLLMAAAVLFAVWQLAGGGRLQTDLTALLPQERQPDVLLLQADEAAERQLNGQIAALVGHRDAETAFQTASELAGKWRGSGLFARVDSELRPDVAAMRQDGARFGLAFMPQEVRAMLAERPADYFRERAEAAVNPFAPPSLLPLSDDWLGFGRYLSRPAESAGSLQWHGGNGMLYAQAEDGQTYVLLRGVFSDGITPDPAAVQRLADDGRAWVEQKGGRLLAGGGALFTAAAKIQAERESGRMGAAGLLLTFALLFALFRSKKITALLLPLAAGMAAGLAAVLAVFGEIHILTVVIGTSLIGMLVDFPLHWLTPSLFLRRGSRWQAKSEMRKMLPVFAVGLLITASGYALLWFTPLPVLRQTAVFSAAALTAAFGATVLWLPPLFADYHGRPSRLAAFSDGLLRRRAACGKRCRRMAWAAFAIFLAAGCLKSSWHDDIRSWVSVQPELLSDAREIGRLAGISFGTQAVLVEANDEDTLLARSRAAEQRLQKMREEGALDAWDGLGGRLLTRREQRALQEQFVKWAAQPAVWRPLRAAGMPSETVKSALSEAAAWPQTGISDGLAHPLAEAWRPLYLGRAEDGRFAALIRLHGLHDAAAVQQSLAGLTGVHWTDKRAHLNSLFLDTRNQAAWLKLLSFALTWLVLWKLMGRRRATAVMAVPLAAAAATVACLGWLGLPVSLFAMFGLLLVAAVGIDYAVYALSARHSEPARLGGMAAAAATTGISFVLLAFSSTPAVAVFGLTVALGTAWNVWFAVCLLGGTGRKNV